MADKELLNEKRSGTRIFFEAPPQDVVTVEVHRSEFKDGQYKRVAALSATDGNGDQITSYIDSLGAVSDWYIIRFVRSDGSSSDSVKFRVSAITPIKLYFQEPALEDRDVLEVVIRRSTDGVEGPYLEIEKFRARDDFGTFKNVWTDMGGSTDFFYTVQYVLHRWDIPNEKSVIRVSEESDPVQGKDLTSGELKLSLNIVVTDWTSVDAIETKEYVDCGYHRTTPEEYFCGTSSSPYSRSWSGDCTFDPFQRNYERLLLMIKATGEPVQLYKRKWEGDRCKCADRSREHPIKRCPICFGTMYVGGYDKFASDHRDDGLTWMRFSPSDERLNIVEHGLTQDYSPQTWTLPTPRLRPRDFFITYDPIAMKRGELRERWRYVVSAVTQNDLFCNMPGRQVLSVDRLDRTDVIYQVDNIDISHIENYYSDDATLRNLRGDAPNLPRRGRS